MKLPKNIPKNVVSQKCSVNERNITLSKADNEFHKCNNLVLYSRCYFKCPSAPLVSYLEFCKVSWHTTGEAWHYMN